MGKLRLRIGKSPLCLFSVGQFKSLCRVSHGWLSNHSTVVGDGEQLSPSEGRAGCPGQAEPCLSFVFCPQRT